MEARVVPANHKIGDQQTIAMPSDAAAEWFGAPPPDLSLITRKR